ncbi:nitrate reductase molybdenum cofactor assembly chaperone [Rhodococcus sp. F64268]|uniref:nitrate reductase molybdenum cofactor assembly chaperone n=1 Tax=Rhodococcus sp. F64268 TaxID=2926402 RepID=UPI001FF322C5|nr:nitrate reductase molybdenum cofactor assembly chaperone [Rhodococcus sp. F64268]MCK0092130.1 nitrate reductase molybdenum cofactor assembly chaperone [Rhodococcus sp. F64268]
MKLLRRSARRDSAAIRLQHRAIRQAASLLLAYPDERTPGRLVTVGALLDHITGPERDALDRTASYLHATDPLVVARDYVETFDMRRRSTMYLTYWTGGDTRNRGAEIHAFASAYRGAGVEPPVGEAPDHLPVVLEFAATVDPEIGEQLLAAHRAPLDVLHTALVECGSPYADTLTAVCATLPPVTDQEVQRARHLAETGPPAEAIGLQPFTLTVPPRRDGSPAREGDRPA